MKKVKKVKKAKELREDVLEALGKQVEMLKQNGVSLAEKEHAYDAISGLTALLHELKNV